MKWTLLCRFVKAADDLLSEEAHVVVLLSGSEEHALLEEDEVDSV